MSQFSWQGQNLCGLSLAFIIDWRVVLVFGLVTTPGNYQALMDYINSHPELNAEMSFGTLQDYFNSVREASSAKTNGDPEGLFKTLSGDFFTYADRNDNYWSGLVNNSILFSWLFAIEDQG